MLTHLWFDLFSYLVAGWLSWKVFRPAQKIALKADIRYMYYMVTIIGFVSGALIFGSLNVYLSLDKVLLAKSVLGALFGAIIAIEIYKKILGISHSTGAYFVPSLAIGIVIGRIGCFFAGLEDYTYGVETVLPWGYDFGDGVMRHPVQLYESAVMFAFFIYAVSLYRYKESYFAKHVFYQFVFVYALQRFIWEFIKPYETLLWGLNLFQVLCLMMMGYAVIYLKRSY